MPFFKNFPGLENVKKIQGLSKTRKIPGSNCPNAQYTSSSSSSSSSHNIQKVSDSCYKHTKRYACDL